MNVVASSGWMEYFVAGGNAGFFLATAGEYGATLWTQDEHFKDIEGVKYIEKQG